MEILMLRNMGCTVTGRRAQFKKKRSTLAGQTVNGIDRYFMKHTLH